jgi:hypothetical protein
MSCLNCLDQAGSDIIGRNLGQLAEGIGSVAEESLRIEPELFQITSRCAIRKIMEWEHATVKSKSEYP